MDSIDGMKLDLTGHSRRRQKVREVKHGSVNSGMAKNANTGLTKSLERSCRPGRRSGAARPGIKANWLKSVVPAPGLEHVEAYLCGRAYESHRHDTYAVGYTLTGVQSFNYRGEARSSLPGQAIVLHPDELHDGRAGSESGFHYRMTYIEPSLVSEALGGITLPFVREEVSTNSRLLSATQVGLADFDQSLDDLKYGEVILSLAEAIESAAGRPSKRTRIDRTAVLSAREFLHANIKNPVTRDDLEIVSGLDRWTLTRQFRAICGTSPYRYLTMRRLERARVWMLKGAGLAEAAHETGFSDQSHMTRQFKKAYGMTPGRWVSLNTRLPS